MVVNDKIQTDLVDSPLKNDKKHRLKQRFDVQRKLGQGTYGKVQLAVNRETGQEVAVKTIKKVKIESEQDLIRIRREIQIMSSIQHPHIIHIYEVFENKDKIVLVMQFASGGELYDYLSEKKVLSDLEARRIFRQIAAAVYYCHKNKICHRDLKLENILLDEKGNAKIADFGLSNVFDEKHLLKTYCGSPLYASPEIVKGVPYCGPEVDCWSMGVLLYTLVYGAMPFDGSNFKKLVTQISEGDYFEPKKKSNATELIHQLLTVNPEKRATIVDICMDYWVNLGYEHSLLQVAEDMANLTPVRLDLLLALAPGSPIPDRDEFQEESDAEHQQDQTTEKDTQDEDEEEEEEEDYNTDTAANSFAYMKAGSRTSHLSISSPNLLDAVDGAYEEDDDETEFLPADVAAALQEESPKRLAERSFGASLARISSLAHRSKKPRKSDSSDPVKDANQKKAPTNDNQQSAVKTSNEVSIGIKKQNSGDTSQVKDSVQNPTSFEKVTAARTAIDKSHNAPTPEIQEKASHLIDAKGDRANKSDSSLQNQKYELEPSKSSVRKDSLSGSKVLETACLLQKRGSITTQEDKTELKKIGRPPGKITIPKTFDSPQSTPSPKVTSEKKLPTSDVSLEGQNVQNSNKGSQSDPAQVSDKRQQPLSPIEDINKNVLSNSDSSGSSQPSHITEEKKNMAKGILKKGIAKAKLAERRMSKQSSVDSDVSTPPVSLVGTPEPGPSFFKVPKPYGKESPKTVESKAEIKLSSAKTSSSTLKNEIAGSHDAPLWEGAYPSERRLQDKNLNWSAISSTIDSEMSGWREQMEESLRRLSPEDERAAHSLSKTDDDKPLVPIARSYKKFTFTKDGACITETKKIYTTPGADGSWTKVEKKTKITTRPGNAEEFEKFRDLHLRNDSPLTRSDSQSSSGSNEKYDDIFDSWTGDTMMCNMRKMNNMFQRFSQDPFLRKERRRNPFRFFRRTESERNEREKKKYELRNGRSVDRESSENEEDYDVHFDDSNAVMYGSQGLWQLLRSANRGLPERVTIHHEPVSYTRSISQDRSESKFGSNWKRCGSRASSGYNTGTRSQSRDRTESPRDRVLRFVFDSPSNEFSRESGAKVSPSRQEKWSGKRNPRRDSGVGSDGYESEYSVRQCPSDDMSKAGRVSSMSSIHNGGRQDLIRNFMKSWSKEFTSPPLSPTSLGSAKEQLENLSENRKNRVEQWLHMNNDHPFNSHNESQLNSNAGRKCNTSHNSNSPAYATMRPRDYLRYNRSSSDKLADYDVEYFPSFEDSHRAKTIHKDRSPGEASKMRFRTQAYSPVSEESSKESHSIHHSDGSNPSVHHINFTISDGRVASSHTPPHSATRYMKTYTSSKDGQHASELPPTSMKFEQTSPRNAGQPVVQMRVSFNKGGRENQVVHIASQSPPATSMGLWEQHGSPLSVRQSPPLREVSPLPGIRTFSTEVAHSVGGVDKPGRTSLECDITASSKKSPHGSHTGKNSPYNATLPCNGIWNLACSQTCMNNECDATNINLNAHKLPGENSSFVPQHSPNNIKHYLPLKNGYDSAQEQSSTSISNGANTPDSLEDLSFEQILPDYLANDQKDPVVKDSVRQLEDQFHDAKSSNEFELDIKPLGVLWNNCNVKSENSSQERLDEPSENRFVTCSRSQNVSTPEDFSDDSESIDLQKKCIENTSPEVGSIWEQKNASRTFDLLKNLLCDEGLESFSSSKCILEPSETKHLKNCRSARNTDNIGKSPVIENHIVINDIEGKNTSDNFQDMMPFLMDDLQSPKEVLRQAMRICESFEH